MAKKKQRTALDDFREELGLLSREETRKANLEQARQNYREKEAKTQYREANKKQQAERNKWKSIVDREQSKINSKYKLDLFASPRQQSEYIKNNLMQNNTTDRKPFSLYNENFKINNEKAVASAKERNQFLQTDTYKKYWEEDQKSMLTQYLADKEQVENEKTTTMDKINIFRPFLARLEDAIDPGRYKLENGEYVDLPSYNELKANKVASEMGALGQSIHGASGSIGGMAPSIVASLLPNGLGRIAGPVMTFATVQNSAYNQKLLEGYEPEQAKSYSIVNAGLEAGLSAIMGGVTKQIGGKMSMFSSNLSRISENVIKNPGVRRILSNLGAEEAEELMQMVLDPINEHVTLGEHKNIGDALSTISSDDAKITALSTLFTIGITEGKSSFKTSVLSKNIEAINKQYGTDFKVTTEGKVTDKKTSKEVSNTEINDTIKKIKISEAQDQQLQDIEKRQQQVEYDYKNGNITEEQYNNEYDNIKSELKTFKEENEKGIVNPITEIEATKNMLQEQYEHNTITEKKYNEELNKLQTQLQEISGKDKNVYQYTENNSGKVQNVDLYFDNSEKTKNYINMLEKIATDKNLTIVFDDSLGNDINGQDENDVITINPNSTRTGEFIAVHELTHAIGTDQMRKIIDTYRKSNAEFNTAVQKLINNYNGTELTEEAMADVAGQLFGNQEFINNLADTNPSLFKRIYQEIKYLYHQFTGYKNQDQFIEDLQYKWEQAYRSKNKLNNIKGYSVETLKDGTQYVKLEDNLFVNDDGTSMSQKEIYNSLIGKTIQFNDGIVATIKAWLPGNKNMYNELFKRYPNYQNVDNIKKVNNKINENVVELLEQSDNISPNEPDYKKRHAKNKITNFDTRRVSLYDGNKAYDLDFSIAKMQDGNYVAYAKRNLSPNNKLLNSIKKEAPMSKSQGVLPYANNIPQSNKKVKSDTLSTNSNMKGAVKYSKELDNSSFSYDNQGRKLSKQQQEYFKDSKATDENGNLITVYHTMTNKRDQFNEFNPVGTDYYKFGDQVVNYYTDSKKMSASYADGEYEMADTKKITSMEEAKSLVKQMNAGLASENTIRIETKDKGYQLVNNIYKEAYEYAKSIWDNEITPEEKQIEKDYEELYKRYVESGYDNNLVPEFTSLENYAKDYAQKLDRITDNMTPEERDAFLSFRKPEFVSVKTEPVIIGEYNSENELFRNLKQDIQKADSIKNKYQYEGYVNITNPYIIDAEGRNWNKVESKKDSVATTKLLSLDTLTKDRLSQLATDSKNRYNETYKEFQKWLDATNSVSGSLRDENSLQVRLGNRFIRESTLSFTKEFVNNDYNFEELEKKEKGLGETHQWRVNNDVMYNLYNNDLISYEMYDGFVKTLEVPQEARNKAEEVINQIATYNEYDSEGHNPQKKQAKLVDIWEKYVDSYKAYENNGRYDYSLFDSQLLDGYLKEELENSFPIKEPGIGINYDYLKDLYKSASHNFDENYIRLEYNDWSVTNDIVKSIIELNKVGENYDGVIIKNVVDYGGYSDTHEPNDLYITFNSNQFKAVDNTEPTQDADIRYSKNNTTWKEYLESNFKTKGTTTKFADIVKNSKVSKNNTTLLNENDSATLKDFEEYNKKIEPLLKEQEAPPDIKNNDVTPDTTKLTNKELKILSKNIKDALGLTNKQRQDLEDMIQDASTLKISNKEELFNALKDRFGIQAIETEIEDIRNIKNVIRNQKLNVSENIKNDITDYNKLKQSNFGKIRFSNNGLAVDTVYQELSEQYPNYFPSDILNESDQFKKIVEVANLESKNIEEYTIDDDYLQEVSDYIYDSIKEAKQDSIKRGLEEDIKSFYKETKATPTVEKTEKLTRKEVRRQLLKEMKIDEFELSNGNDISSMNYQLTDPIRVNEKVFGRELGKKINEATIEKTKHNTAEKTRWLKKEREEIKELGIKPRSKESSAVQKYGEKQYVNDKGELVKYGDQELIQEFPNVEIQNKIKKASKVLRNKYDQYIDQINTTIEALGYDPIPKRKDYMRHFQELGDVFSQTGIPFNLNDMRAEDLPTDINGLTEFNKPGKNWFASSQKRYGVKTNYDAITGIDEYLEGAGNLIYHTEDIQRYRALSTMIRDTFGQTKGFENLEGLSNEEVQKRISDIQSNKLSKYVAWLDEQANSLAGKKGAIDRGVERAIGRKAYTALNTIKKQVGSNMTGFNVRSAMTNFISTTIASSKTNKLAMVKGTVATVRNMFNNDGYINKSDFLTSRFGSDMLSKKAWQKASNAGQIFMIGSDYLTANIINRSKYYEGIQKGMTESEAIKYADDFSSRVMGDRSQGSTAEAFNSKTLGILTQFQLEVNNQWQYMLHDSKMDYQKIKTESNGINAGATIVFQLGQLAGFSYLFNELFEKLTGSRSAFDPIEIIKKLFGTDDDDEEKTQTERIEEAVSELLDNIPFGNLLTGGGRIPISEALPIKQLISGQDKNGYKKSRKEIVKEAFPYYIFPTGYGQLKKTSKGLSMYNKKLPIAGSYTNSGNLRFTADTSTKGKIKSGLFGQYANDEAQKYIKSGYKTISNSNINEMKKLNMSASEYREYRTNLNNAGKTNEDKITYIVNSKYTNKEKNIMASNVLNKKFDVEKYKKYGSYQAYKYAQDNPSKYNYMNQIGNYDDANKYIDDITKLRNKYKDLTTAQRKVKVIKYVNGLNLNIPQKAMLLRNWYSSYNGYNQEIYNYINKSDLTPAEKLGVYKQLGFKVKGGRVYW